MNMRGRIADLNIRLRVMEYLLMKWFGGEVSILFPLPESLTVFSCSARSIIGSKTRNVVVIVENHVLLCARSCMGSYESIL